MTDDTSKSTFWNDRIRAVQPTREGQPLRWILGPCKADPDPTQKWCNDCYGVIAEEGTRRWCRACKASETISDPARQGVVDELIQTTLDAVRYWLIHDRHISCSVCKGGAPTLEQLLAKAFGDRVAGRTTDDPEREPAGNDGAGR